MQSGSDEHVDRVTSLAVGLAFSNDDGDRTIAELVRTARRDAEVLRAARGRVYGLAVGDMRTHQSAIDLIDEAVRLCEQPQTPS